jgi:nucleotide-binding universal stress UspA family protein
MMPPKLILAPIDFSDPSRNALNVAADMASRFGASLLLVHIVPAVADLPAGVSIFKEGEYDKGLHDTAAKQLADLGAPISGKGVSVRTEIGTANDIGMEIVRIAASENADMIVIATHGMTGWRKIAFGSVAEKVVQQAECPVLVLRTKAAEQSVSKSGTPASSSATAR